MDGRVQSSFLLNGQRGSCSKFWKPCSKPVWYWLPEQLKNTFYQSQIWPDRLRPHHIQTAKSFFPHYTTAADSRLATAWWCVVMDIIIHSIYNLNISIPCFSRGLTSSGAASPASLRIRQLHVSMRHYAHPLEYYHLTFLSDRWFLNTYHMISPCQMLL